MRDVPAGLGVILDARAAAEGSTRSEVLRALVDRELNLEGESGEVDAALAELAGELAERSRQLSADDPDVAIEHGTNLLLVELIGAAVHHRASVRITPRNEGRTWAGVMDAAGVDFATVDA